MEHSAKKTRRNARIFLLLQTFDGTKYYTQSHRTHKLAQAEALIEIERYPRIKQTILPIALPKELVG